MAVIELSPHPKAPLFKGGDASKILEQALTVAGSGRFSTANEEIREVLRQAGLVSLWFFLKFVAGFNGPYNDLTDHVHVEMCNFYQRVREPGQRAAAFLPRGFFKSSVFTHGGNSWTITRDSDVAIGLGSGVIDRSIEFLQITERTFDSNEFFAWLYPEFVHDPDKKGTITDKLFVVPNRTRYSTEPTIKIFAVGGSTQGIHVTKAVFDDAVGDAQLTSERTSSADMQRIQNWIKSNSRTLLRNPVTGIVLIVATRYDNGDAYEPCFQSIKRKFGYWDEQDYEEVPGGIWDVYNREADEIHNGEVVATFPERVPLSFLEALKVDDWWTYITQYKNNPRKSSLNEFVEHKLLDCWLDVGANGDWVVRYEGFRDDVRGTFEESLVDMDLLQAADPAATEKRMSAKTSRSSVVVYARSSTGRRFVLDVRAEYVKSSVMFDWMFANRAKWPQIRVTVLEAQGPFKVLVPYLRDAEKARGEWLHLRPVSASTDKDVRIRTALEGPLGKRLLYATKSARLILDKELAGFPNALGKDAIDALALAEVASIAPTTRAEREVDEEEVEKLSFGKNPVTGY